MPVVNREVVLPCDRERAWELITEPEELAEWYGEAPDAIEEVTEGERIVFRTGDSRVEWRLEDAVSGTRLHVTEHRFTHDAITWGPKLSALARASMLCPA